MKQAKLGIVFVVAIMALAAVGAGYAMWSQTLTITGTINTGEFIVGVRDDGTGDPGDHYPDGELYPDGNPPGTRTLDILGGSRGSWDLNYQESGDAENDEGKNIASTESENDEGTIIEQTHEGITYYEHITETVDNAYPYYQSWITITFANIGTVPAKINDGRWVSASGFDLFPWLVVDEIWIVEDFHEYDDGVNPETQKWYGSFTEAEMNGFQYQLDPCDTITFVILFHFEETAMITVSGDDDTVEEQLLPEGKSMTFTYEIEWAQWNEVDEAVTSLGTVQTPPGWYLPPTI